MPKIPRINSGSRPSGVPSGPPAIGPDAAIAPILGALGDVAGSLYKNAAEEEREHALRMRAADEEKQSIMNEVDAGRLSLDYEIATAEDSDALKTQYFDAPDKVPDLVRERGQKRLQQLINSAPNADTQLQVAKAGAARLEAQIRKDFDWKRDRQTQQTKENLEGSMMKSAIGAKSLTNAGQLPSYLEKIDAELGSQIDRVYGKEAAHKMHAMKQDAVDAFVREKGLREPLMVREAIRAGGVFDKYAKSPEQRTTWENYLQNAIEHRGEVAQLDILTKGAEDVGKAVGLLNSGNLTMDTVLALQNANEKKLGAVSHDESFTPEQKTKQVAKIKEQGEVLRALQDIVFNSIKATPEMMLQGDNAMISEVDKTIKTLGKSKSSDLLILSAQMDRLIKARWKKEITLATFNAKSATVNLELNNALDTEKENTGHWWWWKSARQAGNRELDSLFSTGAGQNATEAQKAQVRVGLAQFLNSESTNTNLTKDAVIRKARELVADEMGVD